MEALCDLAREEWLTKRRTRYIWFCTNCKYWNIIGSELVKNKGDKIRDEGILKQIHYCKSNKNGITRDLEI